MKTIIAILFSIALLNGCATRPSDGSKTFVVPLAGGGYDYVKMTREQLERSSE